MPKSSTLVVALGTAAIVGLTFTVLYFLLPRIPTEAFDVFETQNNYFRIRVTAYKERTLIMPGGRYVFESSPSGSTSWSKIMTFRHDDRIPIPRDQIRFVNDRLAYVFMGDMFAVTTDGGQHWSVWEGDPDLFKQDGYYAFRYLRRVEVAADGTGTMTIEPLGEKYGQNRTLHTQDYGRHWRILPPLQSRSKRK